jgi:hypothetical protein
MRFKVGDWIVCTNYDATPVRVSEIDGDTYTLSSEVDGNLMWFKAGKYVDANYELTANSLADKVLERLLHPERE